jgi:hypothetical protein
VSCLLLRCTHTLLLPADRVACCQVRTSPQPSWGWDPDHSVLAEVYPFHNSAAHDSPSSSTLCALRGSPVLSDTWLPRQRTLEVWLLSTALHHPPPHILTYSKAICRTPAWLAAFCCALVISSLERVARKCSLFPRLNHW